MKKTLFYSLILCLTASLAQSQTLGEFKPKDQSYGLNKLKGKAKKVYIAAFNVNYQIYNEMQDFKQGGRMVGGGAYRGDASAKASVGLEGLTAKDIQKITDQLYSDYTQMLKSKGLTIISADEAAKTSVYNEYIKMKGGEVSLSQIPGCMASAPTGYEYFIKRINKDGRAKSGGFLNNPAMLYPKLSSELDDAVIADVNLYVLFASPGGGFIKGPGASVKITTNLRLADTEAIVMTDDRKAVIKMKGQNETIGVNSAVNFYHGKMGMGATSSYLGSLSKPLSIDGIVENTKVKSAALGGVDFVGTETLYGTFYSPENKDSKTSQVIPVDAAKYDKGVYSATKTFLEHHTKEFLNKF